jgi:hypothetical protein
MMRVNTKKFKLLQFLASRKGTRYMDIERFICEMNGLDYDMKRLSGFYKGKRAHSGIWATNLTCGRDSILKKHCVKVSGLWYVNSETKEFIESNLQHITKSRTDTILSQIKTKEATTSDFKKPNIIFHEATINHGDLSGRAWQDKVVSHGPIMSPPKEDEEDWGSVDLAAKINATSEFSPAETIIIRDIQHLNKMREMTKVLSVQRAKLLTQITKLNDEILLAEKSLSVKLGLRNDW